MEAELPPWNALVQLLIRAKSAETDQGAVETWATTVLEEGPLAAAAVAESLYDDDGTFRRALREALYARDPRPRTSRCVWPAKSPG